MFRDFSGSSAWTDAMRDGGAYVGLIQYQPKREGAPVEVLWVFAPGSRNAAEAEDAARRMLARIRDISADGRVRFDDGISL
ncbi:hypothetical protein SAMN05216189_1003163 [Pseudomonas delhiensis]|uniref:Uncharacterized protein n=1 Tax=Pseudomonas delhiensis TaxID=366289 RepID=A0A239LUR7_9PSED|nr:hypothetical protein [Pseudomonas delhiensis]SDI25435.1 hypothetical protein SAMN05216189_1003163 [Pseudomonas delhiensis]SNT34417.1 hypothetical protein SAMN06295949_12254 [Pseudomonas delhiensis]